jgi:hypothetical protein
MRKKKKIRRRSNSIKEIINKQSTPTANAIGELKEISQLEFQNEYWGKLGIGSSPFVIINKPPVSFFNWKMFSKSNSDFISFEENTLTNVDKSPTI